MLVWDLICKGKTLGRAGSKPKIAAFGRVEPDTVRATPLDHLIQTIDEILENVRSFAPLPSCQKLPGVLWVERNF
jgi:hypothetical protein